MQGKAGLLIASVCGAIVLTSFGYGMGRRAALKSVASSMSVTPAGSPFPAIQIEPIQPQDELAAINSDAAENLAEPAQVASTPPAVTTETASAEEMARVQQIQLALKAAGFNPGSSDGKLGPRTKIAVRDFQQANGLDPDGKVGSRTWSKLEPYLKTAQAAVPATQGQGD